ncbi:hypothetical protein OG883_43975 [Streptomyces sp. NBC_01142]|uniref:hypothetical protein n=1 Tax=Streptomyces sp. NBC_01142 TaxID=2975865 RepID=UPI002252034B|nr:hypothetical protein [Streptomyces sp. NBC_01142]MCX4826601.1 hypothetical protein [Streptomyces sp. NBC_01142]
MYKKLTSTELADALDRVQHLSPELTGPLSMLDEASLGGGPVRPAEGQVWAGDGDVLQVENFDGALKVFGEQVVYDEVLRALASFSPPAVAVADAHHER